MFSEANLFLNKDFDDDWFLHFGCVLTFQTVAMTDMPHRICQYSLGFSRFSLLFKYQATEINMIMIRRNQNPNTLKIKRVFNQIRHAGASTQYLQLACSMHSTDEEKEKKTHTHISLTFFKLINSLSVFGRVGVGFGFIWFFLFDMCSHCVLCAFCFRFCVGSKSHSERQRRWKSIFDVFKHRFAFYVFCIFIVYLSVSSFLIAPFCFFNTRWPHVDCLSISGPAIWIRSRFFSSCCFLR